MNFPNTKIEETLARPDKNVSERRVLEHFYLDVDTSTLYAADGFILAAVLVETTKNDQSGIVPSWLCEMQRNGNVRAVEVAHHRVVADDIIIKTGKNYPSTKEILERDGLDHKEMRPHFTVDARKFWRLAQALCQNDDYPLVNVWLGNKLTNSIIVEPTDGGAVGAIMPIVGNTRKFRDLVAPNEVIERLRDAIANESETITLDGDLLRDLRQLYPNIN